LRGSGRGTPSLHYYLFWEMISYSQWLMHKLSLVIFHTLWDLTLVETTQSFNMLMTPSS
jgi:hypothetical protein